MSDKVVSGDSEQRRQNVEASRRQSRISSATADMPAPTRGGTEEARTEEQANTKEPAADGTP